MIISGGSRRNATWFAGHLTNERDNERVELVEFRGLASEDVRGALREMQYHAEKTRCKNYFYHADINPRADETLTPEQWEQAVDTLERHLGFEGQSRFVVEHEKNGRTHRHVIWSRIDMDTLTARPDSRTYPKHEAAAAELAQAFGHDAVPASNTREIEEPRPKRRADNWEYFRGNKSGINPETVKQDVTAVWRSADSGAAFQAALKERGYMLCKGDRRDFCVIDPAGKEHSLARRVEGAKAAEIRSRLSDLKRDSLPTVAESRRIHHAWTEDADTERHQQVRQAKLQQTVQPYGERARAGRWLQPASGWAKKMRGYLTERGKGLEAAARQRAQALRESWRERSRQRESAEQEWDR